MLLGDHCFLVLILLLYLSSYYLVNSYCVSDVCGFFFSYFCEVLFYSFKWLIKYMCVSSCYGLGESVLVCCEVELVVWPIVLRCSYLMLEMIIGIAYAGMKGLKYMLLIYLGGFDVFILDNMRVC